MPPKIAVACMKKGCAKQFCLIGTAAAKFKPKACTGTASNLTIAGTGAGVTT